MKLQVFFLMSFPIPFTVEQQHPQHTANTHLMHFLRRIYSALKQIASHGLSQLGFSVWHSVQNQRDQEGKESKRKRGRERTGQGKKEKGNLNWSLVNLQTFFQGAYMV